MTTLAIGATATVTLKDDGKVAIASNGGFGTLTVTPVGGTAQVMSLGPIPERRVIGPYGEGAVVTVTNLSAPSFDYDLQSQFDPAATAITGGTIDATPIGGTTPAAGKFTTVTATGQTLAANGNAAAPGYSFSGFTGNGFFAVGAATIVTVGGVSQLAIGNSQNGIALKSTQPLSWSAGDPSASASDLFLFRDAANTLAQRNGTAAQAFNVYNTYADASNFERAVFDWKTTAGILTIGATALGTGTQRSVNFNGASYSFLVGGVSKIVLDATTLKPTVNGNSSLGASNTGFSKLFVDFTNTATVGAVTIDKAAGRVNIAAAGSSIVVTNAFCTANAHVFAQVSTNDGTAYIKNVVPAAGSFTITLGAAATAQTSVDFFIVNAD